MRFLPTAATALLLVLATTAFPGCAAEDAATAESEEDVASSVRLEPVATPADLTRAAAGAAAASGLVVEAATFRYDAARTRDPKRAITAVRSRLAHPRLRKDEGAVDDAVLRATLDEYGVTEARDKDALAAALAAAAGEGATTRKLWLRSDDVAGAESEWAEIVLVYVSPARGQVIRLTLRYEA